MESITINVAGIGIRVEGAVAFDRFRDIGMYKNFIVGQGMSVDCLLDLEIGPPPDLGAATGAFSPQGNWQLSALGDKNVLQLGPPPRRGYPDNVVVFSADYTAGAMYQKTVFELFRRFIDQFLLINLLSRRDGFLLHASGAICEGKGLCFIGPSGAGKSTILRLFSKVVKKEDLLNDDRLALRKSDGRWRVYGTPYHGEFRAASPASADLAALFFIRQAKRNYVRPLSTGEVCRELMVQTLIPLWDKTASERVVELFASLLTGVRAYELGFLPDASVIDLIKKTV